MRITNPCPADWSAMPGDDTTRHCAQCGKTVTHVDAMDDAAFATLRGAGGGRCVRGAVDGEGRLLRALVLAGATAAAVAGGGGSVAWNPGAQGAVAVKGAPSDTGTPTGSVVPPGTSAEAPVPTETPAPPIADQGIIQELQAIGYIE